MDEPVRWVTKAEAAEELEVSLSSLDRKIRNGEVEVRREGRRVFVRMAGEYITDEELLRRAVAREHELERTVRELEQSLSELKHSGHPSWSGSGTRPGSPQPPPEGRTTKLEMAHRQEVSDAQGDEGRAQRRPRDRPGAVGAADRQRSPVVVCAEVEEALSARHPGLQPHLRET